MSLFNLKWIGVGQSPKTPGTDASGMELGEKFIGMENFGNTCYANSILQSLYHSKAFRDCVVNFPNAPPSGSLYPPTPITSTTSSYFGSSLSQTNTTPLPANSTVANGPAQHARTATNVSNTPSAPSTTNAALPSTRSDAVSALAGLTPQMQESLFTCMRDLFLSINGMKKRTGVIAPNGFVTKLRKENELFRSTMHQDAHEFLNYLLNAIAENVTDFNLSLMEEPSRKKSAASTDTGSLLGSERANSLRQREEATVTWVHRLFEGILTNETRCLTCETVTNKDESFLDLSIDIEQHSSVTACLRQFSASELLCQRNKFFCDKCCGLQEAEKRMKIKRLPNLLALHLKRFKYQEKLQKYIKLTYRVVFPFELRLFNTSDDIENPDRLYELYAIVVHIGAGPYHGHYIAIIKSGGKWWTFDDQNVDSIEEADIEKYYGDIAGQGSGYVLFYQAVDLDMDSLGLAKAPSSTGESAPSTVASSTILTHNTPNGSAMPAANIGTNALALQTNNGEASEVMTPATGAVPIPRDHKSSTPAGAGVAGGFADRFFYGSGRKKEASTGSKDLSRKKSTLASMTSWKGGSQEAESADESGGERSSSEAGPAASFTATAGQTAVVLPGDSQTTPKKAAAEATDANGASSMSSWFRRKEKADRKERHGKDLSTGTDDLESAGGDFSETESNMDTSAYGGDTNTSPNTKKKSKAAKLPRRISLSLSKNKKIAKESGEDLEEVLSQPVPKTPDIPAQFLNQSQGGRH